MTDELQPDGRFKISTTISAEDYETLKQVLAANGWDLEKVMALMIAAIKSLKIGRYLSHICTS